MIYAKSKERKVLILQQKDLYRLFTINDSQIPVLFFVILINKSKRKQVFVSSKCNVHHLSYLV